MSNSINVMAAEGSSLDTVNTPLVSISKSRWIVAILSTGMIAWLAFTFPPKVWRIPDELANVGALSPKADQDKLAAVNNQNMWNNTLLKFGLAGSTLGLIGFFMLGNAHNGWGAAVITLACGVIVGLTTGALGLLTKRYLDLDNPIPFISDQARPLFCDIVLFTILSVLLLIPYAVQLRFQADPAERAKAFSVPLAGILTGILVPVSGAYIVQGHTSTFPPAPTDLTALWFVEFTVLALFVVIFMGKRAKSILAA